MKITIDGHGGHLCEAWLDGTGIWETGISIDEAIGRLLRYHPQECGVEIKILPCSTTAYNDVYIPEGK